VVFVLKHLRNAVSDTSGGVTRDAQGVTTRDAQGVTTRDAQGVTTQGGVTQGDTQSYVGGQEYHRASSHSNVRVVIERELQRSPNGRPDIIKLLHSAAEARQKYVTPVSVSMSAATQRSMASVFATHIIVLFAVLRAYVPGGHALTDGMPFIEFLQTTLPFLQHGLTIHDATREYAITIIEQRSLLVLLAGQQAESSVSRQSLMRRRANCRAQIQDLMQVAVDKHGVNPEQLRLVHIARSVLDAPSAGFKKYRLKVARRTPAY
jgi:hypothetical protein